jgi:hypothetical protein
MSDAHPLQIEILKAGRVKVAEHILLALRWLPLQPSMVNSLMSEKLLDVTYL